MRSPLVALLGVILAAPVSAASFPPRLRFRSIESRQAVVHFHQGLEAMAREAATLADEILDAHEARYGVQLRRVHVVLADTTDDPNGFALPFPYPLVHVRAAGPAGNDGFGNHDGWLRLVLTHELAHVVHLEQARGVLGFGRKLFGRAPFLFPNSFTPSWLLEGLATWEETEGTAFGRGRNPDARMTLRMATLEGDFPGEDRGTIALDRWPGGNLPYLFGEAFLRDLERRFGPGTLPELTRVHSRRVIPYLDDWTAHTVTGATFHTRWREWRDETRAAFEAEAGRLRARGLTPSRALTDRGVRQLGPRFSPDGAWIAYTSRTLTHYGEIRLMRPDGNEDRPLHVRNGGSTLSWTPDGRAIVFDEPEVFGLFTVVSDLRLLDAATGAVRRLTRGLRARDPDVAPDGARVVFVREKGAGSELALIGLDGTGLRELTSSAAGTRWSGPRFSPRGDVVAASRWSEGGWLDIVLVDVATGELRELTRDRAKDVEPAWAPDGERVVFRSDRDGVSNLHAVRLADGALLRVSNVLGGAFTPDVAPDGRRLAFASYSARGYDVRLMAFEPDALAAAAPFDDAYPEARPRPAPSGSADRSYRPWPTLLPRFWAPYASGVFDGEAKFGVVTGGLDPLFRHAYGLDVHYGTESERIGLRGFYQYDRWRPTFTLTAEDTTDVQSDGGLFRTRELILRGTLPLARSYRSSQSASLAWRRRRETLTGPAAGKLDLGALEAAYSIASARQFAYSISPVEGWRLRVAYLKEAPAFGSEVSLGKLMGDARAYTRVFGDSDALALRLSGGATFGRPGFRQSYAIGGFPDASLLDLVRTNAAVLRGYPDNGFRGRKYASANLEYRVPLGHPQHGLRSLPFFLRHLHLTAFADAGHAWSGELRLRDVKTSAGLALGADLALGHFLPLTGVVGVARGFDERGETQLYVHTGLSF